MPKFVVTKTVTEYHLFTVEASDEFAAEIEAMDNDKYYCDSINADFTDVSITDVREVSK